MTGCGGGKSDSWKPHPLQQLALMSPARELFFGGLGYVGKSDCVIADFARHAPPICQVSAWSELMRLCDPVTAAAYAAEHVRMAAAAGRHASADQWRLRRVMACKAQRRAPEDRPPWVLAI